MNKDLINILPDNIANQIAAGEVIQRPASVVKELIENSVDAGSSSIHLILKQAGKNLIQVVDDGKGMSPTDARICFERHATSKILKSEDLFKINTKGFRGEAMAAISSIAQVDLCTKRPEDIVGTQIKIIGSEITDQLEISCKKGSNISVKNLFFNTPARRKFLKSNAVELKHCLTEFHRVALTHPEIEMIFTHNDDEMYRLPKSSLKQRIVHILGKNYAEYLFPISTDTDVVSISGYLVKPEHAKKTRGEQYFFINKRFIKNAYLNHAVSSSFEDVLPKTYFPGYVIFLEVEPSMIDINIHPTKTEVKFENEQIIYSILKSTLKKSIAQYGVMPSIDFDQESSFNVPLIDRKKPLVEPTISTNENFNPFEKSVQPEIIRERSLNNDNNWENLYEINQARFEANSPVNKPEFKQEEIFVNSNSDKAENTNSEIFQIHNKYIVSQLKSGVIIIHQQRAHERILYDKFLKRKKSNSRVTQQLLFPESVDLKNEQFSIIENNLSLLKEIGFDFEIFGKKTFIFRGIPTDIEVNELPKLIDDLANNLGQNIPPEERDDKMLILLSKQSSVKTGTKLIQEEMHSIIDRLFASSNSEFTADKKKIIHILPKNNLDKLFNE